MGQHSVLNLFPSRTVALEVLGFQIHWYGLMYLFAFLLAFWMLPRLQRYRDLTLTREDWSSLLAWGVLGVIVGGRLGFVFFYEPAFFLKYPLEILQVWHGGMSSHGGFVGVALALFFFCKKHNIRPMSLFDLIVIPTALGLALGRVGNFINGELYGTVTSVPWAMSFEEAEGLRHPTQLYAVFKDLFIALVCFHYLSKARPVIPGRTLALFLMLYGILRYLLEYFRDQPYGFIDLGVVMVSRGQLLTVPIIIFGLFVWWRLGKILSPKS